jgi:uncharacterized protein
MIKYLFCFNVFALFYINCISQNYAEQLNVFREKYKTDFIKDARSPIQEVDFQFLDFY